MACCGRETKVKPIDGETDLENGPLEDRSCRDVIFLIVFILFIGGMGYVSYHGIRDGNPYRLLYGSDSWGNICNQKNDKIPGAPFSGKDMTEQTKTFYFDETYFASKLPGSLLPKVNEEDVLVTCVRMCPNETLVLQSSFNNYVNKHDLNLCRYDTSNYVSDTSLCPKLPISKQTSLFNRCLPETVVNIGSTMAKSFTSVFSGITLGSDITEKIVSDLKNCWEDMLYLCALALGSSLLIVTLMWLLAAIIIYAIILAVIFLCLGATAYSWYSWYKNNLAFDDLPTNEQTEEASDKVRTWLIYASLTSSISVLILLILLILRKRITLVVQLFKEAGKALKCIPLLLIQPIWTLIILLASVAGLLTIASFIETSGLPTVNNKTGIVTYEKEELWQYLRWYHYFGILWISAFIVACQDIVIAGAIATWYFKRDKKKLGFPILKSTKRLIRYHLGSVAFGSFIIALVRMARLILGYIQKRLHGKVGKVAEFLLKVLQCCLWCFEKCLAFLNRNAYIEIAIYGYGFCKAAKKAFLLIVANALRVAAINSIGDVVLFLGKLCTVAIVLIVGNEFFKNRTDVNYFWVPITVSCAFAFAISHCFLLVYEITIDTIFLCFCEDCERNDGVTKPYFMSKGLMQYLEDSNKAIAMKQMKKKQKNKESDPTDLQQV